jgi:hypothetical protein
MAINVSFNGATIYKPGAYSKVSIDLGGGFPLSPTGLIAIFGEAAAGAPGSSVPNISDNVFSPEQIPQIKQLYRSGPIVDAVNFLFAPGADGAIPGGAQAVYIYKTNASVRAALALANTWGSVRALEYGVGGNKLTYKNVLVPATSATTTSSAPFSLAGGAADTNTLVLRIQGADADNTFTVPASTTTRALLQTALTSAGNWSGGLPSGVGFTVGGASDAAATVTISRSSASNPQREGAGRNFELVSGSLLGTGAGKISIAAGLVSSSSEDQAVITISNKRDLVSESSALGGTIVIKLGRSGVDNTDPQVTINATQILLKNNSVNEHALNIADFATLSELASYINTSTSGKWAAVVSSNLLSQQSPAILDRVTALGANASSLNAADLPAQIKKDAKDVRDFFAQSSSTSLITGANSFVGLPDAASEVYLAGGAAGATSTGDVTNALTVFEKIRVNSIVPLMSRDASDDIADGLTDPASSYTIAGIHQSVKTHCSLMATTKRRSERQGYLSLKDTYANCKDRAADIADSRQQLVIQDINQVNSDGAIQWFQPWALACLLAGARGGSPIGNPMTNKYLNCSGIRQTAQPMSTSEEDIVMDFDPDTMYDDAIQSGITFLEHPQSGGFKVVVDNTTYGRDGNWVYNRANVLYAADVLAFDFRTQLENIYVGLKNTIAAAEVKSTCESILATYLAQGITVSTADAKGGFKQLVVQITGNVINVSVVVKLVEGIDFVLADITLQRAQNSA